MVTFGYFKQPENDFIKDLSPPCNLTQAKRVRNTCGFRLMLKKPFSKVKVEFSVDDMVSAFSQVGGGNDSFESGDPYDVNWGSISAGHYYQENFFRIAPIDKVVCNEYGEQFTPTDDELFVASLLTDICNKLEINVDFVDFIRGYQLNKIVLSPHETSKIKQLQADSFAEAIQGILRCDTMPIIANEKGFLTIAIPRQDRQFCLFKDFISKDSENIKKRLSYHNESHETSNGSLGTVDSGSPLKMAIGVNVEGQLIEAELRGSSLQHIVMGGAPRQGKSQAILSMIGSLITRYTPDQIRFICMDGKGGVTLNILNGSPYLLAPVATDSTLAERLAVLIDEIVRKRYEKFSEAGCQDIDAYNRIADKPLPYIAVFIDEFQDLYTFGTKPKKGEVDVTTIFSNISSLSPAAGIFIVWASQRIDGRLLPSQINSKAVSRICLKVQKESDSEFVLNGEPDGAYLLGKGDMIYQDGIKSHRLQGLFIPENELAEIFGSPQHSFHRDYPVIESSQPTIDLGEAVTVPSEPLSLPMELEPLASQAIAYIQKQNDFCCSITQLKQNWGKNLKPKGLTAKEVDEIISQMERTNRIETIHQKGSKAKFVRIRQNKRETELV
jgi:hypothetical protein